MTVRLRKEIRELLPVFVGTLLLIVVPYAILRWYHKEIGLFAVFAYGLGCALMAGISFGSEFQHRTLSLLLSQPIQRAVLWREKMLVLGAGILASLGVVLACLRGFGAFDHQLLLSLPVIALCAFCGTPYLTLLAGSGIAGMAFSVILPFALLMGGFQVSAWLLPNEAVASVVAAVVLLLYCAVAYWRGRVQFGGLQVLEGTSREISLPAGLEAFLVRRLAGVSARFPGPFGSLLKKEFRLQQISFLLAGVFCLTAAAGAGLYPSLPQWASGVLAIDFTIYLLIMPFIVGSIAVAEERSWGISEWHLTLPPSALRQWSAKMLVTLAISLGLGLLLPFALCLAGRSFLGLQDGGNALPPAFVMVAVALGYLAMTSVASYTATFANGTLRALLWAFGIVVAVCPGVYLAVLAGESCARVLGMPSVMEALPPVPGEKLLGWLSGLGLLLLFCLLQRLAWSNFRQQARSPRRLLVQLFAIFFVPFLLVGVCSFIFWTVEYWNLLRAQQ